MAERASPLGKILISGSFGANQLTGPGVVLSEKLPISIHHIAGWDGFEKHALPGLKTLGFKGVGDYRKCSAAKKDTLLYRTAPDRVLVVSTTAIKLPSSLRNNPELAVLDLSHSRTRLIVEGPAAEDLMARLAPIDFRIAAMPVAGFVQTGIHHIAVLIRRAAELRFEILTPVTWARSLWEYICLNAVPFGYDVRVAA